MLRNGFVQLIFVKMPVIAQVDHGVDSRIVTLRGPYL
jgi:hypothetical protein